MNKPFITYTAQIKKLKNDKNLIISDLDFAVESLQNISYYALIGGYKQPFIDIHTRKYINNARFEDIVALYEFDEELRGIFFKYLCRVERRLRSSISYHFCEKHGERQDAYLNPGNYNTLPKYKKGVEKLIHMLDVMAKQNKDHEYIVYQRNKWFREVPSESERACCEAKSGVSPLFTFGSYSYTFCSIKLLIQTQLSPLQKQLLFKRYGIPFSNVLSAILF